MIRALRRLPERIQRVLPERKAALQYPIPPAPRTAVLVPWLRSAGPVRVFEGGWSPEAALFAPAAIAGTREQLLALEGTAIPSLTHAILILGRAESPRLTEDDRERLWRAFRVPVFEQILGESGELLAAECEAHDGLHIESDKLQIDPNTIDDGPCGCGRSTPRFGLVQPAETLRRVAAYAR